MSARACPVLPARNFDETASFYRALGFDEVLREKDHGGYLILRRGSMELHFFGFPAFKPSESYAGAYVRLDGVDQLHAEFGTAELPASGIPRMSPVADMPWGMREFHVMDPSGSLLKFGSEVAEGGRR